MKHTDIEMFWWHGNIFPKWNRRLAACVCCPIACVPVALLSCVIGVFLTGSLCKSTSFERVAAHQHRITLPSVPHEHRQIYEPRNNVISVVVIVVVFFLRFISVKAATQSVQLLVTISLCFPLAQCCEERLCSLYISRELRRHMDSLKQIF